MTCQTKQSAVAKLFDVLRVDRPVAIAVPACEQIEHVREYEPRSDGHEALVNVAAVSMRNMCHRDTQPISKNDERQVIGVVAVIGDTLDVEFLRQRAHSEIN